ncbi:MAG: AAA family ATPase [Richelia sp. RM2_1_2]|nr:AAA family ATPase [Richelia sp. RM2_1_2]
MKTLLLMRGSPGAGKDHWLKENNLEEYSLSADNIRLMIQSPILNIDGSFSISQKNDKRVWGLLFEMLEERMNRGEFIIVNATHSKSSDFAKYKKLVEKYRYRVYCLDKSKVPLETLLKQNHERPQYKWVPDSVIHNQYSRMIYQNPPTWVKTIQPNEIESILQYQPLDYNRYKRIAVIGDIHGSFTPLKEYFEKYPWDNEVFYIFLGDFNDRGSETVEVFNWLIQHFNRKNFGMVISNHGEWLHWWAFEDEAKIRSMEFNKVTKVILENANFDKKLFRNITRKEAQFYYFTFGPHTYFCNHGGLPIIPPRLALIPSQHLTHGVGRYEDLETVIDTWNTKMPADHFSIIGHRNINKLPIINGRYCVLEGQVEFGGNLRIVHLEKDGSIIPLEFKNNNYVPRPKVTVVNDEKFSNDEWMIKALRSSKDVYENKHEWISSFNFKKNIFFTNKWSVLSMLARSFFINNQTNEIIARSWEKFFNYKERDKNTDAFLSSNLIYPVQAYEKENGFLFSVGYDSQHNELVFCSKSSVTSDFAQWGKEIFYRNFGTQSDQILEMLKTNNLCLVFEVVDPVNDPHIIKYHEPQIILLDAFYRTFETRKLPYDALKELGGAFGFNVKKLARTFNSWNDLYCFLNDKNDGDLKSFDGKVEGYVLEDANGYMFKKKNHFYCVYKYLRSVKEALSKGRQVNLSKMNEPVQNEFYSFLIKKSREELNARSMIEVMEEFFAN